MRARSTWVLWAQLLWALQEHGQACQGAREKRACGCGRPAEFLGDGRVRETHHPTEKNHLLLILRQFSEGCLDAFQFLARHGVPAGRAKITQLLQYQGRFIPAVQSFFSLGVPPLSLPESVQLAEFVFGAAIEPVPEAALPAILEIPKVPQHFPANRLHQVHACLARSQASPEPHAHKCPQARQVLTHQLILGICISLCGSGYQGGRTDFGVVARHGASIG